MITFAKKPTAEEAEHIIDTTIGVLFRMAALATGVTLTVFGSVTAVLLATQLVNGWF